MDITNIEIKKCYKHDYHFCILVFELPKLLFNKHNRLRSTVGCYCKKCGRISDDKALPYYDDLEFQSMKESIELCTNLRDIQKELKDSEYNIPIFRFDCFSKTLPKISIKEHFD